MLDTVGNGAQITSMTGQVHFLRALCYFELLKRFGGVPLITKVYTTNDTKFTETRSSWDSTLGIYPVGYQRLPFGSDTYTAFGARKVPPPRVRRWP